MSWKAGPEKPRTVFCWMCGARFHGRVHAVVRICGAEHDIHKACIKAAIAYDPDCELIGGSTTIPFEPKPPWGIDRLRRESDK